MPIHINPFFAMPPRRIALLLGAGSLAMLAGAAVFEHGFGLAPCIMCLWQRWPHRLVILLGLAALPAKRHAPLILAAQSCALITGAGIAFWHGGVEYGLLPGPASCGGFNPYAGGATLESLLATAPPRCDEVAWSFAGLSMAMWNGVISLVMAAYAMLGMGHGKGRK